MIFQPSETEQTLREDNAAFLYFAIIECQTTGDTMF